MKIRTFTIAIILIFVVQMLWSQQKYALVIHGGAGAMSKSEMSSAKANAYKKVLQTALSLGDSLLKSGATSEKTVVEVIKVLEDSPLFNAGKGAVFTYDGKNELDASIMNGKTLNAGAVAGVTDIKNPIVAAREVMHNSNHVLLTGKGASKFAKKQNSEMVSNCYFHTQERYQSLRKLQEKKRKRTNKDNSGTVGCVALDQYGNLCAGTSTGGMTNKRYGRIGDTPIIGAGTYANNNTCSVSCTGHGEYYIRLGFARDVSALMEYKNASVEQACKIEIEKLSQLGGTGGVIAIDKLGNIAMQFNTNGMFRAYKKSNGQQNIAIF